MVDLIANVLPQLVEACRRNGVSKLWLFGSATGASSKPFTPSSDIDLLVEFNSSVVERGLSHPLFTLPAQIEAMTGRPTQLTENLPFRNPFFRDEILRTRVPLYDDESEEAVVGYR